MPTDRLPRAIDADFADAEGIAIEIPAEVHTLAGFRSWVLSDDVPEKLRVSYLRGKVTIDMSKEEILSHAAVKTAIAGTMLGLNESLDFGDMYIHCVLVSKIEADVSNNPDMVGISWESVESGKVHYVATSNDREMEIEGFPDWVLEIVSRSSVTKDKHARRRDRLSHPPLEEGRLRLRPKLIVHESSHATFN